MRSRNPPFWVGDRQFTAEDLVLIIETVRRFKLLSREELAATLCENLPWKAPNGKLKLNACRLLLEGMDSSGLIKLPPKKNQPRRTSNNEPKAKPLPCIAVEGLLKQYRPVTIDMVEAKEYPLWNATMATYHPLGYRKPFGAHQRYWIRSKVEGESRILGAILFAASAKAVADRDAWIGWTLLERKRFRYRIVNNSRFLILPGVHIPHLASHVLSLVSRRLRADWFGKYGYAPVLLETFVTPPHRGTCYRAANWQYIGKTAGFSRNRTLGEKSRVPIKMMFAYPLIRNWRTELCAPTPVAIDDEEEDTDLDA
jgi:hypothetical protein